MILSGNVPDAEFRALFVHEFGHLTDLGCLTGTSNSASSAFQDGKEIIYQNDPSVEFYSISWLNKDTKRHGAKEADFVSGYASWDPFEDFAESFIYYVLQRDAFRERAQSNTALARKLQWLETNIFTEPLHIATSKSPWTGKVPWDITKLAYEWHPGVAVAQR